MHSKRRRAGVRCGSRCVQAMMSGGAKPMLSNIFPGFLVFFYMFMKPSPKSLARILMLDVLPHYNIVSLACILYCVGTKQG